MELESVGREMVIVIVSFMWVVIFVIFVKMDILFWKRVIILGVKGVSVILVGCCFLCVVGFLECVSVESMLWERCVSGLKIIIIF